MILYVPRYVVRVNKIIFYSIRLTDCRSAAELRREDSLATLTAFVWVAAVIYKMLPPHGHCRNIYFYKQLQICISIYLYKFNF